MTDSELHDSIDDSSVKSAFAGYRADPGGEVRVDASAIAGAGRRRVRRNRILTGVTGVAAAAVLITGFATMQPLGGERADRVSPAAGGDLPSTGRSAATLFAEAWGKQDGEVKPGGSAEELSKKFLAGLDGNRPAYADTGWQDGARWALFTWTKDGQAAEGLLMANDAPVYVAIYPPPYQTCTAVDEQDGRKCTVREVKDKGWLKVIRNADGKPAELKVSLQRVSDKASGRCTGSAPPAAPSPRPASPPTARLSASCRPATRRSRKRCSRCSRGRGAGPSGRAPYL
jgi:hypothetical protein